MKEDSRKKRIETILKKNFSTRVLLVRDDSKNHEGHSQVSRNNKESPIPIVFLNEKLFFFIFFIYQMFLI